RSLAALGMTDGSLPPLDRDARALAVPRVLGDAAFAQLVLLDLAVLGGWQRVDELDVARHGEVRHARLEEADTGGLDEHASGAPDDRYHDLVLGEFGAHRKGRRRLDLGMTQQHLLDLERRDVLAAPANRILQAIDETVVAVRLPDDAIAGVEPEIAPRL